MKWYEIVLREWTQWDGMLEGALRASVGSVFKGTVQPANDVVTIE